MPTGDSKTWRCRGPIQYLGLDEPKQSGDGSRQATRQGKAKPGQKSFRRGHVYATMLNDLDGGRVWDLVEGRKEEQARELLQELDATQRAGVKAVAMDIWSAYRNAVEKLLPQADIVHDKFHLCAYLNKAVDTVRKAEHRQLAREGRQTLKGSKYLWLRNFPDLLSQPSFRQLYRLNLRASSPTPAASPALKTSALVFSSSSANSTSSQLEPNHR